MKIHLFPLALAAVSATPLHSAVLANYNFGIDGSPTFSPTTPTSGISGNAITEGDMNIFAINANQGYPGAPNPVLLVAPPGSSSKDAAQAVSTNSYFTFTLTPDAGHSFDLTTLTFNASRGGGSTRGYAVRTSADNYAANIATDSLLTNRPKWTPVSVNLSSLDTIDSANPLTFRIYAYAPANTNSVEFDDIIVNGDAVPEPSSLALLGVGLAAMAFMRRRK